MKIYTVWGVRKYGDPQDVELIAAWDEFSVDSNPEGFEEEWRKGLESWGDDLLEHRHVVIDVPHAKIFAAFETPLVEGDVV